MTPHNVRIFVYTEREGMLSPVGHDLKLAVNRFDVDEVDGGFAATIEADSLTVDACIVDGQEGRVSEKDEKSIEKNINKDVLRSKQFKFIEFEGNVTAESDTTGTIRGTLRLLGKENPLEIQMRREGDTWRGEAVLDQRDYGIKPYTAFLGALRIKPEIRVEVLADVD